MAADDDLKSLNERVMTGLARFPGMSEPGLSSERAALAARLRAAAGASPARVRGDLYLYYLSGLCRSEFWKPIGAGGSFYDPRSLDRLRGEMANFGPVLPAEDAFQHFIEGSAAHLERRLKTASQCFRNAGHEHGLPFELTGVYSTPDYAEAFSLPDLKTTRLINWDNITTVLTHSASESNLPIMIFCGDSRYMTAFAPGILASLQTSAQLLNICFALCGDSLGDAEAQAERLQSDYPRHRLTFLFVDGSRLNIADHRALYTVLRFYVADWLLKSAKRAVILYDLDAKFSDNFQGKLFRVPEFAHVGLNFNHGARTYVPWRTVNAQCVTLSNSPDSLAFLELILRFVDRFFDPQAHRLWFIDQQALFWCHAFCQRFIPALRFTDNWRAGVEFTHIHVKTGI